jgi:hypothetical protein
MPPAPGRRSSSASTPAHAAPGKSLRLVKGSHIVVPKLFDHDHAYIFQNPDKRIIFAIPYEGEFTLIGTTDVEHRGATTRRGAHRAPTRSPTCASRPAATSSAGARRPTWCGAIPACARCSTTSRATRRR